MTFWYAPASAFASPHAGPSLLPCQPPNEISTSPPAARIALIVCWSAPPVSGRWLSQDGLQPFEASMNAIVNALMPVADITEGALGGSPQPRYRYGAAGSLPPGLPPP